MDYEKKKININIGDCEVEAWYSSEPSDGYAYSIDVGPCFKDRLYKDFHLMRLKNIELEELPNSCRIMFQSPKSEFKRVNFVELRANQGVYELEIILCIDYHDWEMKESVSSFIDRFCDSIKNSIELSANPVKTEYGYFVHCVFIMSGVRDIYEFYTKKEAELERYYRNTLADDASKIISHKYGEDKLHWWVRYVIVPLLLGSGAIAAVLAKFLLT